MHAFSDVHLHLMLFVDVFPCFPFHFDFVYQPYIGYMLRYTSCIYIYMYKRAGTSDILTFVYTTGLVVFWIDLCRNCVKCRKSISGTGGCSWEGQGPKIGT